MCRVGGFTQVQKSNIGIGTNILGKEENDSQIREGILEFFFRQILKTNVNSNYTSDTVFFSWNIKLKTGCHKIQTFSLATL